MFVKQPCYRKHKFSFKILFKLAQKRQNLIYKKGEWSQPNARWLNLEIHLTLGAAECYWSRALKISTELNQHLGAWVFRLHFARNSWKPEAELWLKEKK